MRSSSRSRPARPTRWIPQQRLLLEVTQEALENAGIPAHTLRHSQTGVFAGACLGEYGYLSAADLGDVDSWSGTGGALSIIANRVSYYFDLRGPSVTIDTACSSSLVTIHLACQSLRAGDSNLALAAGVNVLLSPAATRSFDQLEALSKTGQCHAFDASADGFVRGEGCGVTVLKRLSDAQRDGDRILAVIRGSAVNQDGRSNGLMAPNPAAQMAVLRVGLRRSRRRTSRGRLRRGARHRNTARRSDRGARPGHRAGPRSGGRRPAADRGGQIKPRAPGGRRRYRRVHQGRAGDAARADPRQPRLPEPQPAHPVRQSAAEGRRRTHRVAARGSSAAGRRVVVRLRRHQRPRGDRAGTRDGTPAGRAARRGHDVGGVGQDAGTNRLAGRHARRLDGRLRVGSGVACRGRPHPQPSPVPAHQVRDRRRPRQGSRRSPGYGPWPTARPQPGVVTPHTGACKRGVAFVYSGQGSQWAGMAQRLLADESAFVAALAEIEPVFVEQVGFSLLRHHRQRRDDQRRRPGPARADGPAAGPDRALAVTTASTPTPSSATRWARSPPPSSPAP